MLCYAAIERAAGGERDEQPFRAVRVAYRLAAREVDAGEPVLDLRDAAGNVAGRDRDGARPDDRDGAHGRGRRDQPQQPRRARGAVEQPRHRGEPGEEGEEEGAALGVPVAVLRNVTERPEGVEAGVLVLAGNDPQELRAVIGGLLGDETQLARMRAARNPYGDGQAAGRIAQAIAWHFGLAGRPENWS